MEGHEFGRPRPRICGNDFRIATSECAANFRLKNVQQIVQQNVQQKIITVIKPLFSWVDFFVWSASPGSNGALDELLS